MIRIMVKAKELKEMKKLVKDKQSGFQIHHKGKTILVYPVISIWIDRDGNLYTDMEGKEVKP